MSFAVSISLYSLAHAKDLPGKGIQVQGIQSTILEESFQTIIIDEALKKLGYETQPIKMFKYRKGYEAIANGQATYSTTSWYPLQNGMYQDAGGNKVFLRKGHYIRGAAQGYLVDKKTADKFNIVSIDDLNDPTIAVLFDVTGDGKADMVGCQKSWSCAEVIDHQLKAYKLEDNINQIKGLYAEEIPAIIERFKQGKPVIYYAWTPYWVSGLLAPTKDVIWLEVPFSAHPHKIDTTLANGKNYGFRINSERIISTKKFAKANPAAAKLFEIAELPINDVSAENRLIADGENSPGAIRQHALDWIKTNQKRFNSWIEVALKSGK